MDNIQSVKDIREEGCNPCQYRLVKSLDFPSFSQLNFSFENNLRSDVPSFFRVGKECLIQLLEYLSVSCPESGYISLIGQETKGT